MRRRCGLVLASLLMVGACGGGSDSEPPATPDPTDPSVTTAPAPSDPTLTGKPTGASQSLTGVVSVGVEDGCLLLTTTTGQSGTWQLVGSLAGVEDGDRLTVRGSPAPDLATRCQQGTPFVVESVEPG